MKRTKSIKPRTQRIKNKNPRAKRLKSKRIKWTRKRLWASQNSTKSSTNSDKTPIHTITSLVSAQNLLSLSNDISMLDNSTNLESCTPVSNTKTTTATSMVASPTQNTEQYHPQSHSLQQPNTKSTTSTTSSTIKQSSQSSRPSNNHQNKYNNQCHTNHLHYVADKACRGLRLRDKYNRGGTRIGLTRAHQLCKRENISLDTIKRMHSFFSRHSAFKKYHGQSPPANSEISWLLWGGDPGFTWTKKILRKEDRLWKQLLSQQTNLAPFVQSKNPNPNPSIVLLSQTSKRKQGESKNESQRTKHPPKFMWCAKTLQHKRSKKTNSRLVEWL